MTCWHSLWTLYLSSNPWEQWMWTSVKQPWFTAAGGLSTSVAFYPVGSVGKVIPQGKNHNWIFCIHGVGGCLHFISVKFAISKDWEETSSQETSFLEYRVMFTFSFWNFRILCNSCARAGLALCWTAAFFLWPLLKFLINNRLSTAVQMMLLFLSVTSVFIPTNVGFALEGK